ncbi:putative ABC transport system permease protein [Chitinivorax tropicus]|uniref:Putative ABC transport system permease protein n=1 Tax=Chitinivorax tropicus TaxID=714531 RepID=A0A840MJA9_9PROT|nr:FtsX-like permease family protein [Chitinivorax tropicus]MBB5016762.1 putative ABC transport system permease protein [Chitinivorax tropicus]
MVSVARAALIYEWRRFLPAVLAVAFAGLLVQIQLSLLLGMFGSIAVYIDRSSADLWVGYPGTQSVDLARPIPGKVENSLRMHPDVVGVERFTWTMGDWQRPTGGKLSAVLIGIDPKPDAMTFATLLTPALRQKLLEPGSVLVDEADLDKLGVKVGDDAELSGKRVRIVATVNGIRAMGGANVLTSLSTARGIDPYLRGDTTDYFLIRLKDPQHAESVRDALQPDGSFKPFQVWTAEEFSIQSQLYWLLESGAGSGFLFSSALGLLVGIVITSQTLMGAIVAALREYATLRALGVSTRSLRAVVVEQSFWVGLVGLLITAGIGVLLVMLAQSAHIALSTPIWAAIFTGILVLGIALMSGLAALRALNQAEPFTLLR